MIISAKDIIGQLATDRGSLHKNHASQRVLSDGYNQVGLAGEFAFGMVTGLMPDISEKPKGDNGVDFRVKMYFTVDIKTARKPVNLIHEEGKPFADIYVLAAYDDSKKSAELIGWEWGAILKNSPTRDFGYGVINHYIPAESLRDMGELYLRMAYY